MQAERTVTAELGGNCHTPIATYATVNQDKLSLEALVASSNGKKVIRKKVTGLDSEHLMLAKGIAKSLIDDGALNLINESPT